MSVEIEELSADEWEEMVEGICHRLLGHDLATFRERWASGEYSWSHDLSNHCALVRVAMLLPETCE